MNVPSGSPPHAERASQKLAGSGYRLTITKDPQCNTRVIKQLVRKHVPGAETISNVSGELAMSLPTEEESKMPSLLKDLSEEKDRVGINNFGLSVTTLEDVFLKVGAADTDEDLEVGVMMLL